MHAVVTLGFVKPSLISDRPNVHTTKSDIHFYYFLASKRAKINFQRPRQKPYFLINARVVIIEKVDGELIRESFVNLLSRFH